MLKGLAEEVKELRVQLANANKAVTDAERRASVAEASSGALREQLGGRDVAAMSSNVQELRAQLEDANRAATDAERRAIIAEASNGELRDQLRKLEDENRAVTAAAERRANAAETSNGELRDLLLSRDVAAISSAKALAQALRETKEMCQKVQQQQQIHQQLHVETKAVLLGDASVSRKLKAIRESVRSAGVGESFVDFLDSVIPTSGNGLDDSHRSSQFT
jgi:chromosome segregation ATPase